MMRPRLVLLFATALGAACTANDEPRPPVSSTKSSEPLPAPERAAPTDAPDPGVPLAKREPCSTAGALRCAGHGPSGLTDILYRCEAAPSTSKEWEKKPGADRGSGAAELGWVRERACPDGCQAMPSGRDDRCNPVSAVPPKVLEMLAPKPYVEVDCKPEGDGKRCSYSTLGLSAEVLVVDPTAEQVARWIVDAAAFAEPLEALRESDRKAWEKGVLAFARHVRMQSSRIFPMKGDIVEDMGGGAKAYAFDRGVVTPCEKGRCRCRINSLTARAFCRFEEAMGGAFEACVSRYDGPSGDEPWRARCAENHTRAMQSLHNDHFRAKAFVVGRAVKEACDKRRCSPDEVVRAIEKELGG